MTVVGAAGFESDAGSDVVIALEDVTVRRGRTFLVDGISWRVAADERWVVLGPNGAGKTTMLQLASAQLHPTTGTVDILGERLGRVDVFELRPRIGLTTAQQAQRIPGTERVLDAVVTAAWGVMGRASEAYEEMDADRARYLLDQMGVGHLAERTYGTLSEGERKRTLIARALMTDPELLLFDEPGAGLDLGGREDLVRRLTALAEDTDAPAQVLVTHHVEEIPPGFDRAVLLRDGKIVAQGPTESVITDEHLTAAFGTKLSVTRTDDRYFARAVD